MDNGSRTKDTHIERIDNLDKLKPRGSDPETDPQATKREVVKLPPLDMDVREID